MRNIKKLFKRLTLFDKVLAVLFLFGVIFFAYVFFRKSTIVTINVKVGEDNVRYEPWVREVGTRVWFSQLFYEGIKETDGLGRTMAEVTSIRSYDTLPSRKAVYLTTKVKAVYNRASNQYTFKGKALLIGSPIKLNLGRLLVEGLVTGIEGVSDPREKQTLLVEAQIREETPTYPDSNGTRDYVADAIHIGDEIKDDRGNITIKIIEKKVENAKRLVTTSDGRTVIGVNPLRKDVYLKMEISAIKIYDRYYLFDDLPILIGNGIPINTPTLSVWPEVSKVTVVR